MTDPIKIENLQRYFCDEVPAPAVSHCEAAIAEMDHNIQESCKTQSNVEVCRTQRWNDTPPQAIEAAQKMPAVAPAPITPPKNTPLIRSVLSEYPPINSFWDGFNLDFGIRPYHAVGTSATNSGNGFAVGGDVGYYPSYGLGYHLGFEKNWATTEAPYLPNDNSGALVATDDASSSLFSFGQETRDIPSSSSLFNSRSGLWGAFQKSHINSLGSGNVSTSVPDPENEFKLQDSKDFFVIGSETRWSLLLQPWKRFPSFQLDWGFANYVRTFDSSDEGAKFVPFSPQEIQLKIGINLRLGDLATATDPAAPTVGEMIYDVVNKIFGVILANQNGKVSDRIYLAQTLQPSDRTTDPKTLEDTRVLLQLVNFLSVTSESDDLRLLARGDDYFAIPIVAKAIASGAIMGVGAQYDTPATLAKGLTGVLTLGRYGIAAAQNLHRPGIRYELSKDEQYEKARANVLWTGLGGAALFALSLLDAEGKAGIVIGDAAHNLLSATAYDPDPFQTEVNESKKIRFGWGYYKDDIVDGGRGVVSLENTLQSYSVWKLVTGYSVKAPQGTPPNLGRRAVDVATNSQDHSIQDRNVPSENTAGIGFSVKPAWFEAGAKLLFISQMAGGAHPDLGAGVEGHIGIDAPLGKSGVRFNVGVDASVAAVYGAGKVLEFTPSAGLTLASF